MRHSSEPGEPLTLEILKNCLEENVVASPHLIQESAEVAEFYPGKFLRVGLGFIDDAGGIVRTDADDIHVCAFAEIGSVTDGIENAVVIVKESNP